MNKKISILAIGAVTALTPVLTFAAAPFAPDPIPTRIASFDINAFIGNILGFAWPIIVVSVIILFIVIAFEFINAGGEPSKVSQARLHLIWAMLGVVIILLAFSIIAIVRTAIPGV